MQLPDKHEDTTTKAFAGLRVLDFSTTIAGPHCARMLADMGAEVIKIETDGGETMRTRPPLRKGCSTVFGQLNVGKKSVVLDLKSEDGKEAVGRLVATADILVENFRPGVMRRLRLDYESLRPVNPRLIYCSISGYGQTAIASALYQRTVTGLGQHIDVSMLESMLTLTVIELQSSQFAVKPPTRPMFGPTETANGYVMITVASEKTFQALMGVIGRPEWISDPRFSTYAPRRENWADMMDGVEAWSKPLTTDACLVDLSAAGVPASAYRTIKEALADPQLAHRQALSSVEDGGGSFQVLNLPFRMTGADTTPGETIAVLGEHTDALRDEIGLGDRAPIPSGKTEATN